MCAHENTEDLEKRRMIIIAVRIKDIALKCGVSEGTVDRALNNRGGIKQETKELILRTAKEMKYQPNHLARCLAKGKTNTIGVIGIDLKNTFFCMLIESIEAEARKHGYFMELILSKNDKKIELEAINHFAVRKVDGLIIFPAGRDEDLSDILLGLDIPLVSVYNRISCGKIPHIDVDCRKIMRNAVKHMVKKGYENIWYMDWGIECQKEKGINIFSMEQRRCGYNEGLEMYDLGEPKVMVRCNEEKLLDIVREAKETHKKTALLCAFDNIAIKALEIYRKNGIKVPEDIGIMGFDNIEMLDRISPRICSVDCKIRTIGQNAFKMLLAQINNEENIHDCVVDYSFTEGETL